MEKHLFYYTQHSQYSEPTNKPAVSYCELEDEVHYHPDPFNGHAYVDLGLPSGTLWAKCNVGANSETDYGLYFAWGETQGYADASTKAFSWSDYKYGTSSSNLTKYNTTDNLMELELIDDAAAVNMGGQWHIPSITLLNELINAQEVSHVLTTLNGVNGLKIMNTVDNSKYIFLPAAGFCNYSSNTGAGISGWILSSSIDAWDSVDRNMSLGFISSTVVGENNYERYYGMSVRGVVTPAKNLITFTIIVGNNTNPDETKQAEEGMTWQEWVNSKYNTNGEYIIYNSGVWNSSQNGAIENVTPQDVIVANTRYKFSYAGGSND